MPVDSTSTSATRGDSARRTSSNSLTPISKDTRFQPDFQQWLKKHGYGDYDFAKNPNALPSFGGKSAPGEKLTREPVILVHGNGDTASGWNDVVAGYKRAGYKDSEIYVMSWGDGKAASAGNNYHSEHLLREVRGFIQAVKEYSGQDKVDVDGHDRAAVDACRSHVLPVGRDGPEPRRDPADAPVPGHQGAPRRRAGVLPPR